MDPKCLQVLSGVLVVKICMQLPNRHLFSKMSLLHVNGLPTCAAFNWLEYLHFKFCQNCGAIFTHAVLCVVEKIQKTQGI